MCVFFSMGRFKIRKKAMGRCKVLNHEHPHLATPDYGGI